MIATPDTISQDKPHLDFGIVPGGGLHALWQEVIGPIRSRTFVLTRQIIDAREAMSLSVVSELVPREQFLKRARAIAASAYKASTPNDKPYRGRQRRLRPCPGWDLGGRRCSTAKCARVTSDMKNTVHVFAESSSQAQRWLRDISETSEVGWMPTARFSAFAGRFMHSGISSPSSKALIYRLCFPSLSAESITKMDSRAVVRSVRSTPSTHFAG